MPSRSTAPRNVREWFRGLARVVSWHRRKLAALATVAAVLTGVTALAPAAPDTVEVVRVRSALAGGTVLTADQVRVDRLPPDALPGEPVGDIAAAVGRTLSGRVAPGQILSRTDLVSGQVRLGAGRVLAPLRLADGQLAALLTEGSVVDVLAASDSGAAATVVGSAVRVVSVPPASEDDLTTGSSAPGVLVLVDVDRATARALAQAAVSAQLSVVWR